jgi:hypothetical protein
MQGNFLQIKINTKTTIKHWYHIVTSWLFSQVGYIVCFLNTQLLAFIERCNQKITSSQFFAHGYFPHTLISILCCFGFKFLNATFVSIGLPLSMVSPSSPLLKTIISTSFANFYFSFPLIYLLLLFSLRDQRLKSSTKCSVKSFIAFIWQLDDGFFIGLSDKVKNSSYSSSLVVPLSMIVSPWYCNESFLAFSLLFFLTSRPFPDPYNVTYLYIYYPCKKFFPFIFIHFSKTTINIIWLPFITWNHYQYPL